MLSLIKEEKEMIETVFVEVKQEAMAEAMDDPDDSTEVKNMDSERLDMIPVQGVAGVLEKLNEKTEIDFEDFQDYF